MSDSTLDIDQIKSQYRLEELNQLSLSEIRTLYKQVIEDLIDSKT